MSVSLLILSSIVTPAGCKAGFVLAICSLWGQLQVNMHIYMCVGYSRRLRMWNGAFVLLKSYLLLSEKQGFRLLRVLFWQLQIFHCALDQVSTYFINFKQFCEAFSVQNCHQQWIPQFWWYSLKRCGYAKLSSQEKWIVWWILFPFSWSSCSVNSVEMLAPCWWWEGSEVTRQLPAREGWSISQQLSSRSVAP